MFNEVQLENSEIKDYAEIKKDTSLEAIFPQRIISEIEKFRAGQIDNLIIHGSPAPEDLEPTPLEIRNIPKDIFPAYIIKSIGNFLGKISWKDLENTIRFRVGNSGIVNEETWHGHYQYKYSVFYCLRADPNTKVYFFSANTVIKNASTEMASALLNPFPYFPDRPPFALIAKQDNGQYQLSDQIYDRSDFEKYIKDLDLPDVFKALEKISYHMQDNEARHTIEYLVDFAKNKTPCISYQAGDIALYNERSTLRFSPSYVPSTPPEKDRWILALSVE